MITIERPVASNPATERAQVLLQYLTDEAYRFYFTADGAIIRPAGESPRWRPSGYAHADANELWEILVQSNAVQLLVAPTSDQRHYLHLVNVTDEGQAVFAKEILGALNADAEQISVSL